FSDAGWTDEDDVLLRVFRFLGAEGVFALQLTEIIDVVVVIADRDRENLFRFILFDHETIKVRFDVAGQEIKDEMVAALSDRFFIVAFLRALGLGEGCEGDLVAEVRFHELGKLGLQFFRRRKWRVLIHRVRTWRERRAAENLSSSLAM